MGYPRSFLVDPFVSGVYHCISCCVRGYSLIESPERCAWIVGQFEQLVGVFAIDICDFGLMRNHVHVLLRPHPELAMAWSDEEVARRWLARPGAPERKDTERDFDTALSDPALIAEWRARLSDLGWFHKLWKEPAAKAWNREDDVSGHFWEGRYRSVGCVDESAVLMQATYILLNPVHCGAEKELADSPRTSTGRRLKALAEAIEAGRHGQGVAAYERVLLEPAIPCDAGGEVPLLDDGEWSRRLAERTYERALREAAAEEARKAANRALRFDRSELDAVARAAGHAPRPETVGETDEAEPGDSVADLSSATPAAQPARLVTPGARLLRTRAPTPPPRRIPVPPWTTVVPAKENPWRRRSVLPLVDGCTLLSFVEFLDDRGRVERPDKAGRIDPAAPRAAAQLLTGIEGVESERFLSRVLFDGALAAAASLMDTTEATIADLVTSPVRMHSRDGPATARIAWRGTIVGGEEAAEREAERRGIARAETVRPVDVRRSTEKHTA